MKYFAPVLVLAPVLVMVLAILLPLSASRGEEPKADPFELWRKPDAPTQQPTQIEKAMQPTAPKPAPAPSPAPAAAGLPSVFGTNNVIADKPLNDEPMEDYTQYYQKKQYVLENGNDRRGLTYYWKEPKTPVAKKRYPLVVVLHDEKGLANAGEILVLDQVQKDFPAFIAVPMLSGGEIWSFPAKFAEDPGLAGAQARQKQMLPDVTRMVTDLLRDNPTIDPRRVFVLGCGAGGWGAFGAALHYPNMFAGAVPISSGWAVKESSKLTKIPLLIMHGATDKTVGWSQDVAFYVQQFGGDVHYVAVPGMGHDCADKRIYSKAVWEWMSEHHK
jgi:poly(3-hydroxybutyrate) depolymerase